MLVLGIETSCDETSAAVVRNGKDILSNIVASQVDLHAKWGGVVPEAAARMHVEKINPVIQTALDSAGIGWDDIDAIAVTNRPGLVGALVIGVAAAKTLAYGLNKPLIGVHHLEGHICSLLLHEPEMKFPFICLAVSGGHTELIMVKGHGDYEFLGQTLDDAAGEAFDKCARVLGLGYPGGPAIDKAATKGNPKAYHLPRALMDGSLNFSFSGLKSAVIRLVDSEKDNLNVADAAASFQQAVVDVLVAKALLSAERKQIDTIGIVGGVAANSQLQAEMKQSAKARNMKAFAPPISLCGDNAAMIACAGYFRLQRGFKDDVELDTYAVAELS